MSKEFRPWKIDEAQLLPPSVQDYVPKNHLSRLIVSLVREELDLSAISGSYTSVLGQPPFDPRMMTALLLHGYASGLYSSRRIAKAALERADFMMIVAGDPAGLPHDLGIPQAALAGAGLAVRAGVEARRESRFGEARARRARWHQDQGERVETQSDELRAHEEAEAELTAEVDRWLAAAEAADVEEDKLHGTKRGDEMPDWVADKERRLAKIRAAKAELEAEAKAAAAAEEQRRAEETRIAEGRKKNGKTPAPPSAAPDAKAQRNFTDADSRILLTKDGYIQGYNAQAAVDAKAQVIVAHGLTTSMSDHGQLVGLIDGIEANLGAKPKEASADSGYLSELNLQALADREISAYIATGRAKHPAEGKRKIKEPLTQAMRDKLKRAGWRSRYRLRKQIVEPVFGQIKQARGFRQFLLRGIEKVNAEWAIICTAHNLTKLANAA